MLSITLAPTPHLTELQASSKSDWPSIKAARSKAEQQIESLERLLEAASPVDTSVVVFGSLARGELTTGSDIDWTLLADGQAHPGHLKAAIDIEQRLVDAKHKPPGKEATFGGLSFSHDLVHYIGGGEDTNRNTTQRILLLLESHSLGDGEAHKRVVKQVLKRYIEEDFGLVVHGSNLSGVPRFLLNDIVRYWRTVAVDFAYKRRERQSQGWALRTVKLRMSRKLTYASGLVACFSCAMPKLRIKDDPRDRAFVAVDHLERFLRQSPLEILAWAASGEHAGAELRNAGLRMFDAYDRFLSVLGDEEKRSRLESLLPGEAASDTTYNEAREIGKDFQDALNAIFLSDSGGKLYELTRTYGVF